MRYISLLITGLLAFHPYCSTAQDSFESIGHRIDSLSITGKNISDIVNGITDESYSDQEKAYAIYYWIGKNVSYDFDGLELGFYDQYRSEGDVVEMVLNSLNGVCYDYSVLFKRMMNYINIPAEIVTGRGLTSESISDTTFSNHAWNVVKLNGHWHLIDVTWASPRHKNQKVNNFYFCTDPEIFQYSHQPDDKQWRLLPDSLLINNEINYPIFDDKYITFGFALNRSGYKVKGDTLVVNIAKPDNVTIGFTQVIGQEQYSLRHWETKTESEEGTIEILLHQNVESVVEMDVIGGVPFVKHFGVMSMVIKGI